MYGHAFLTVSAACFMSSLPTRVDPVKPIFRIVSLRISSSAGGGSQRAFNSHARRCVVLCALCTFHAESALRCDPTSPISLSPFSPTRLKSIVCRVHTKLLQVLGKHDTGQKGTCI